MNQALVAQMDRVELADAAKLILNELSDEDAMDLIQEHLESNDMVDEMSNRLAGA